MMIVQTIIFICGALSIYLLSRKDRWQRWGYIVGLIGEPFWVHMTIHAEQWGVLVLCFIYTLAYINGVKNHWFTGGVPND